MTGRRVPRLEIAVLKQLVAIAGQPLIRQVACAALASWALATTVIVAAEAASVEGAPAGLTE